MNEKPMIVVGVDGSEYAMRALRYAIDDARRRDCSVGGPAGDR
jgi:nucleotide-binding universal stress UspA family protein